MADGTQFEAFIPHNPGDVITAEDWNDIQIKTKEYIQEQLGSTLKDGVLKLGGGSHNGLLSVFSGDEKELVRIDVDNTQPHRNSSNSAIYLDGKGGNLWLGGKEHNVDGDIVLFSKTGDCSSSSNAVIRLDGDSASLFMGETSTAAIQLDGKKANLWLGGANTGLEGENDIGREICIFSASGNRSVGSKGATIHLDGDSASLCMGGGGTNGDEGIGGKILLFSDRSDRPDADKISECKNAPIELDGEEASIYLGGRNKSDYLDKCGRILLFSDSRRNRDNEPSVSLISERIRSAVETTHSGSLEIHKEYKVFGHDPVYTTPISIDGFSGEIKCTTLSYENLNPPDSSEDFAEEFDCSDLKEIDSGCVVVLSNDDNGNVTPCLDKYDTRVVGVISGAGKYQPAIVLGRDPSKPNRMPVSLMGKVYCKVDADYAPIELGDLLTTSATPGHAMKATDMTKAFGAVLGKAMAPLESGKGLIPIIVTLQ
jgi:hypothetical protein